MGAWMAITTGSGAGVTIALEDVCMAASGAMGFEMAITWEAALDDESTFAEDAATKTKLATKSKPSVRTIIHLLLVFR